MIATPVTAYQMRNSTLWNLRASDGERLAMELSEDRAREIEAAINERAALVAVAEAATRMLENYRELKQISLALAKSDAPNWVGAGMTVDDDIHVQAVTNALAKLREAQ